MRDPLEGLTESGMIRTGAAAERVTEAYRPIHAAAVAALAEAAGPTTTYAYGSVVTGQAVPPTSDVDLLVIGVDPGVRARVAASLSECFADRCRGVELASAERSDFVGDSDRSYGNRVFVRHYCVLVSGSDDVRPSDDFFGDTNAARGFNGDIAQHALRWDSDLRSGNAPVGGVARQMSRKTLLAVTGLVSIYDRTWTTDRVGAAHRWSEIVPEMHGQIEQMTSWASATSPTSAEAVRAVLDGAVNEIVTRFDELIGRWPSRS